jgi:hypothetical protein
VNKEVGERLVGNLQADLIRHNQDSWLEDHGDLIVISSEKTRWTCATSACAAGFVWLEEAPIGSVFDSDTAYVFDNEEEAMKLLSNDPDIAAEAFTNAVEIGAWASEKLGIDAEQEEFLFYQFDDTAETINRVKFLLTGADVDQYELYIRY